MWYWSSVLSSLLLLLLSETHICTGREERSVNLYIYYTRQEAKSGHRIKLSVSGGSETISIS